MLLRKKKCIKEILALKGSLGTEWAEKENLFHTFLLGKGSK